jgi:hypothetical protein
LDVEVGVLCVCEDDGSGAMAASTAFATVFAAKRVPIPSTRPKRTESMDSVYLFDRQISCSESTVLGELASYRRLSTKRQVIAELGGEQEYEEHLLDVDRILRCCIVCDRLGTSADVWCE